jgi:hypothetical protein
MTTNPSTTSSLLIRWTLYATVLQILMVVAGHFNEFIRINGFAVGGMSISLVLGGLCAIRSAGAMSQALLHGGIVGGISAFLGIGVSLALGDVPATLLLLGTSGSLVAGLIGGAGFFALGGKKRPSHPVIAG